MNLTSGAAPGSREEAPLRITARRCKSVPLITASKPVCVASLPLCLLCTGGEMCQLLLTTAWGRVGFRVVISGPSGKLVLAVFVSRTWGSVCAPRPQLPHPALPLHPVLLVLPEADVLGPLGFLVPPEPWTVALFSRHSPGAHCHM